MADGQLSLGLLKDVTNLFEKIQSTVMLTSKQTEEIIEYVFDAALLTEAVFGKAKSRQVTQNDEVAKAWSKAGRTIIKYLPDEGLGIWLQNKGEAWANPDKWPTDTLEENRLQIEQIKLRVMTLTKTKRKFFRPKNT
jgi:GTP cyclohydrolase II